MDTQQFASLRDYLHKINRNLEKIVKHLERQNGKIVVSGNVEDFIQHSNDLDEQSRQEEESQE